MAARRNDEDAPAGAKEYPHGLRVMAEFFSSGIWAIWLPEENGGLRHGEISHEAIGLPSELAERFGFWIADWSGYMDDPESFDIERFNSQGRALAVALKQHVGSSKVLFTPATRANGEYGGVGPDEEIIA